MSRTLTLMMAFIPCLLGRGANEPVSKPTTFDLKRARRHVAFSYPVPALSHRDFKRQFISFNVPKHESLSYGVHQSLSRGMQGIPLAKFRGRSAANIFLLSMLCQKSSSEEAESSNKTASKFPSWETFLKQRMEGLDFSLMKNDLSLISIYSLGDSIVEVGREGSAPCLWCFFFCDNLGR